MKIILSSLLVFFSLGLCAEVIFTPPLNKDKIPFEANYYEGINREAAHVMCMFLTNKKSTTALSFEFEETTQTEIRKKYPNTLYRYKAPNGKYYENFAIIYPMKYTLDERVAKHPYSRRALRRGKYEYALNLKDTGSNENLFYFTKLVCE